MKASSAESGAAVRVRIAGGLLARARGLLGQPDPAPGCGLLLAGVRAVHGFGLRRPLDVVYLDGDGRVLASTVLAPWRAAGCRAACHVVEMRRGECERLGLVPGRLLQITVVDEIFGRHVTQRGSRGQGRRRLPATPPAAIIAATVIAVVIAIALALAFATCLASEGERDAGAGVLPAASSAVPAAVERHTGEPRRKRVRQARASLHRDAADGTPAKPLRKARARHPRSRQPPVEYFVGEPGRHGSERRR